MPVMASCMQLAAWLTVAASAVTGDSKPASAQPWR